MKTSMIKQGGTLVADNQQAVELLSKIPDGRLVMVDVVQSRNIQNHKRFFSFLREVFDMQEHFDNQESLRKWLIMKTGRFVTIEAPNGFVIFEPESLNFASMDETDFKDFFSDAINVVLRELNLDKDAVDRVVDYA